MLTPKTLQLFQEEQKKLDNFIIQKKNIADSNSQESFRRVKLALLVEIGELANELKTFKHWKANKEINWAKAQEELIDCLHFFLSLSNKYEVDFLDYKQHFKLKAMNWNEVLIEFFRNTYSFLEEHSEDNKATTKDNFCLWLETFEEIACRLGLETEENIYQAYLKKNKENRERQNRDY